MLLPGHEIAHRRESQPGDNRVLHYIHQLINLPRHKPRAQPQETVARCDLAIDRMRKAPLRAGNHAARTMRVVANREHIARIDRSGGRILRASKMIAHDVAERHFSRRFRQGEVIAKQSRNVRTAFVMRDRSVEPQTARTIDHIPLPSQRRKRETLVQQPCIAQIRISGRIGFPSIH